MIVIDCLYLAINFYVIVIFYKNINNIYNILTTVVNIQNKFKGSKCKLKQL
jgi:hypothetical protein